MSEATDAIMRALAAPIDRALNGGAAAEARSLGFVLLVFPLNKPEGARVNYISNGDRRGVLVALKEIVARFEGQAEAKGHG